MIVKKFVKIDFEKNILFDDGEEYNKGKYVSR